MKDGEQKETSPAGGGRGKIGKGRGNNMLTQWNGRKNIQTTINQCGIKSFALPLSDLQRAGGARARLQNNAHGDHQDLHPLLPNHYVATAVHMCLCLVLMCCPLYSQRQAE